MSALLGLLAVVALLMVVTAARVLPSSAGLWVGLRPGGFSRRRLRLALGNERELVLGAWVPGSFEAVAQPWPVSVGNDHFTLAPPHGLAPEIAARPAGPRLALERGAEVVRHGLELRIDGARVATTGVEEVGWWCRVLGSLARANCDERAQQVTTAIASWLDVPEVLQRLEELRQATRRLRIGSCALLVYLFAALPAMLWLGVRVSLLQVGLGYLALVVWCQVEFVLACRRSWPPAWRGRAAHASWFLVSPADALAATAHLSRLVLAPFHPLALSLALGSEHDRASVATALGRALRHPRHPQPADGAAARAAVESLMRQQDWEIDRLVAANRGKTDGGSWCPHCGAEYVHRSGVCSDCEAVQLVPLGDAPDPTSASNRRACDLATGN